MPRRLTPQEHAAPDRDYRQMHLDLMEQYRTTPLSELSDEDLLAVLLSYSMQKCDYRAVARRLMELYGSINNILDARTDALLQTQPLRMNTVLMLKGVPALYQRALLEGRPKRPRILSTEAARAYLSPYFIGYNYEQAFLLTLTANDTPKEIQLIGEGYGAAVYIDLQRVLREGLMNPGCKLLLAHSHTGGMAMPSYEDKVTTVKISKALAGVGVPLLDHLIFAGEDCYPLSADGDMNSSILAFSKKEPAGVAAKLK